MNNKEYGHYTTLKGMMGIVRLREIWATNIKYLNDEHEFQHALDHARKIIKNAKPQSDPLFDNFILDLQKELNTMNSVETEQIFVCSFSEKTDLLSQWRGYCPDNNGYCLIFDIAEIYNQAKDKYGDVHIYDCIYDDKEKEQEIGYLLNDCWNRYRKMNEDERKKSNIIYYSMKEFALLASHFKDKSFSEENERRIVINIDLPEPGTLKFRDGNSSIIPYICLAADIKTIKKIIIGPTMNKLLSEKALYLFLSEELGIPTVPFSDIRIDHSKTPYRSWRL